MGYRAYKAHEIIWEKSLCQLMNWLHCYDHNSHFGHIVFHLQVQRWQLLSYLWVPLLMILAKKLEGHNFYENYIIISHSALELSTGAFTEMSESVYVSITTTLNNDVCICTMHMCVCVCDSLSIIAVGTFIALPMRQPELWISLGMWSTRRGVT